MAHRDGFFLIGRPERTLEVQPPKVLTQKILTQVAFGAIRGPGEAV